MKITDNTKSVDVRLKDLSVGDVFKFGKSRHTNNPERVGMVVDRYFTKDNNILIVDFIDNHLHTVSSEDTMLVTPVDAELILH